MIVLAHTESDAVATFELILARDALSDTVDHLKKQGPGLPDLITPEFQHQFALLVDGDIIRTFEMNRDCRRIGARRDGEIIFKLLLITIINQVDAGIEIFDLEPGVDRDADVPLRWIVADQIIDFARHLAMTAQRGFRVRSNELHSEVP